MLEQLKAILIACAAVCVVGVLLLIIVYGFYLAVFLTIVGVAGWIAYSIAIDKPDHHDTY